MTKKIFIIAGEPSGDIIGGKLMKEIKTKLRPEEIEFRGIGGVMMQEQGLNSMVNMNHLSVMGFVEILPHIVKLLKIIRQTAKQIIEFQPDLIITIDSPDFNFRVMKKIKNYKSCKKIHMIAPSVWAYREKRAQKISMLYDLLLAILPFEPPYFIKYNLKTVFIGHPIVEDIPNLKLKAEFSLNFRSKYGFYLNDTIIYIAPGSRLSEVKRIFPDFIAAINILKTTIPNLSVVVATLEKTHNLVDKMAKNFEVKYVIVGQKEKSDALFAADFALLKSGTNTIEASIYHLPMLICYKVNYITFLLAKLLLKIKFANLINLILGKEIIPELIQKNCQDQIIAKKLRSLIENKNLAENQINESSIALKILGYEAQERPTEKAVSEILNCLKN